MSGILLGLLNGSPNSAMGSASIGVRGAALTTADVAKLTVAVSGPGINRTIKHDLTKSGEEWQGIIGGIPAGTDRTFTAQAFNAGGTLIYQGSATGVAINNGQVAAVVILLEEINPPPPFSNAAPFISALTASSAQVAPLTPVQLNVTASDPNPGDTLTFAWTATGGNFSDPTLTNPVWTADTAGTYTLTITVTDNRGAAASLSFTIDVQNSFGSGTAVITVGLNTYPIVSNITANPVSIDRSESTSISLTASDADGDPLTYSWSAGCAGSFNDATAQNPVFTADANAVYGSCTLSVTVSDGRGGVNTGTLGIRIAAAVTADLAPQVLSTYQQAVTVGPGGTLVFRAEAVDPEGGALTFAWSASAGTMGPATENATTNGTQSEVVWTAPSTGTGFGISVTITDSSGVSTTYNFLPVDMTGDVPPPPGEPPPGGTDPGLEPVIMNQSSSGVLENGQVRFDIQILSTDETPPSFAWSATVGSLSNQSDSRYLSSPEPTDPFYDASRIYWSAPASGSNIQISVIVTRATGESTTYNFQPVNIIAPPAASWSATAAMNQPRYDHTASLLMDGRVLVIGGRDVNGAPLSSCEIYDPAQNTWTPAGNLPQPLAGHAVSREMGMIDMPLTISGGHTGTAPTTAVLSGAMNNCDQFVSAGNMITARYNHVAYFDGPEFVVNGGRDVNGNSVASIESGMLGIEGFVFSETGTMNSPRFNHAIPESNEFSMGAPPILIGGEEQTGPLNSILNADGSASASVLNTARTGHAAAYSYNTSTGEMLIVVLGGYDGTAALSSGELAYSQDQAVYSVISGLSSPRYHHTVTVLQDGSFLTIGGISAPGGTPLGAEVGNPGLPSP